MISITSIYQVISEHLPISKRINNRGWCIFNAPCCQHRGHSHDTRRRGNLLVSPNGLIGYNCYNCGFKTVYTPGKGIGGNFQSLMQWLNIDHKTIQQLKLLSMTQKIEGESTDTLVEDLFFADTFKRVDLPNGSKRFDEIIDSNQFNDDFMNVASYLDSRGEGIFNHWQYYWSPDKTNALNKRIIIPFIHNNKIVGWTARYAGNPPKNTPKYFNSSLQENYMFNSDQLNSYNRKRILLVEGPLDAIAVDGIAALGKTLNARQINWLNQSNKEIIVVPDRESQNQNLIDIALSNSWSVSFPDWEPKVKDCADASLKYGRLYTLKSIFASKTINSLQIQIKRRLLGK
jgi:hypothetical protein